MRIKNTYFIISKKGLLCLLLIFDLPSTYLLCRLRTSFRNTDCGSLHHHSIHFKFFSTAHTLKHIYIQIQATVYSSKQQEANNKTTRQAGRSKVRIAASAKILQQKNKQKRIRMKCITLWKTQRNNLTLPLHGFQNFQENLFYFTQAGRKRDVMPSIFLHATYFEKSYREREIQL